LAGRFISKPLIYAEQKTKKPGEGLKSLPRVKNFRNKRKRPAKAALLVLDGEGVLVGGASAEQGRHEHHPAMDWLASQCLKRPGAQNSCLNCGRIPSYGILFSPRPAVPPKKQKQKKDTATGVYRKQVF